MVPIVGFAIAKFIYKTSTMLFGDDPEDKRERRGLGLIAGALVHEAIRPGGKSWRQFYLEQMTQYLAEQEAEKKKIKARKGLSPWNWPDYAFYEGIAYVMAAILVVVSLLFLF